ncbi:MAG: hypothetical protein JSS72_09385 [Armatimonadetes bacterium]|nr:hypothetical protein [Armatimonadota bacterium]
MKFLGIAILLSAALAGCGAPGRDKLCAEALSPNKRVTAQAWTLATDATVGITYSIILKAYGQEAEVVHLDKVTSSSNDVPQLTWSADGKTLIVGFTTARVFTFTNFFYIDENDVIEIRLRPSGTRGIPYP